MTRLVRPFKRVAAQTAQRMSFKMSAFNHERGLGDFLLDQDANAANRSHRGVEQVDQAIQPAEQEIAIKSVSQ